MMTATSGTILNGLRPISELGAGRPHGDRLRYMAGCRCSECRGANTAYEKARAAARKAGDWNGIVPSARAVEHLRTLSAAGIGRRQVADASGVALSIIAGLRAGTRPRLRALTERALLAVTPQAAADRAVIDARPTWRLLNDLLDTGYTKARLARELGFETPAIQIKPWRCTARTAYDVQQLHARLRRVPAAGTLRLMLDLREEGYRPDGIQAMALEMAAKRGIQNLDTNTYGDFISATAAEVIRDLHAELTEVPA
jgi:hypothetical protein